ncbi:MAG: redoxin domain-containing protein [Chloroflexi bacterium]|jgi:thiol-disulfide isomerase/thioredoxin|nr:redoxin domain-containing protein [Chloroflexota bacterium]
MMPKSRFEWSIVITVAVLLGTAWIIDSKENVVQPQNFLLTEAPNVGHLAPDFSAATPTGETFTLTELVDREGEEGQPVVLNFWATWCGPCRIEMPHFERVSLKYDDRAVILGINQAESAQIIAQFGQNAHVTYPLLVDEDSSVNREYMVSNLPTTIFVDATGIIQEVFVGTMNQAVLESKLDSLLEQ